MIITWVTVAFTALAIALAAGLSSLYAWRLKRKFRDYGHGLGTIVREKGIRAYVEWNSFGEICVASPISLFAIRKRQEVELLLHPIYPTKITINHWTTNGRAWGYISSFLFGLTIILTAIASVTYFS